MGFEPTTPNLVRLCSAAELHRFTSQFDRLLAVRLQRQRLTQGESRARARRRARVLLHWLQISGADDEGLFADILKCVSAAVTRLSSHSAMQ